MKKSFILFLFAALSCLNAQTNVFSENMGSPTSNTAIASNVFENSSLTFTGTADVRNSTASSGYTGASASGNVFFTNTIGRFFEISGINTTNYSNLTLSLGHYKSTTAANNELTIQVSENGIDYTNLIYSRPTGTGTSNWILITPTGSIPSATNLRIRFTQASSTAQFRIDDVKLVGDLSTSEPFLTNTISSNNFSYILGQGPSNVETITLNGSNLEPSSGDINVTAPSNYEVSTNGVDFFPDLNLSYTNGEINDQTFFVRLASQLTVGIYTENLVLSGGGLDNTNVLLNGQVFEAFGVPYSNTFRDIPSIELALEQGFTLNNYSSQTAGGGYLRLESFGSSVSTPISLNNLSSSTGFLKIEFSLTTFGAGSNRIVALKRFDNSGDLETLATFEPTGSYVNYSYVLDVSNFTENFGLKIEYISGSAGSIRFRDFSLNEEQVTPSISAASCNSTINLFHYDLINADEFPSATNYRFKIGTSTFDSATGSATLANILGSGITFGTNYQVSVAAFVGDEWTDFGDECQISTTTAPLTEIQYIACGSTLPNIATNVYFKNGYGVQMYEYQLTRVSDNVVLGTHQTTNRFVKLTDFTGVMYNTEYNLQARMMHNDVWGSYSAACSLFTPNNVTTQLRPAYCGMDLANNFSPIYARGVVGASQYEFRVVNTSTSETGTVVRNTSAFHLGQVQGITVSAATTYNVEVRVNINSSWGPYGTMCTVTTPGIPTLLNNTSINAINDIVAYPNPFNNQFSVKLASSDMANIQLFDINGRLIEMQNVRDAFEVEMGQNANAGVYILKVTQNGETQSFKMIKK